MNMADRIQSLRKAKGISQEQLADKIGVSRQAVSKWESEQSTPDIEKVILLSEFFDVTTDYILGYSACDLSPSVLQEAYTDDYLVQDVIIMLKKLPPAHRQALVLLLEEISLSASMRAHVSMKRK